MWKRKVHYIGNTIYPDVDYPLTSTTMISSSGRMFNQCLYSIARWTKIHTWVLMAIAIVVGMLYFFEMTFCNIGSIFEVKLPAILNIFADHDIEYWLGQGGLIGLQREGHFLPHDYDLDISVLKEHVGRLKSISFLNSIDELGHEAVITNDSCYFMDINLDTPWWFPNEHGLAGKVLSRWFGLSPRSLNVRLELMWYTRDAHILDVCQKFAWNSTEMYPFQKFEYASPSMYIPIPKNPSHQLDKWYSNIPGQEDWNQKKVIKGWKGYFCSTHTYTKYAYLCVFFIFMTTLLLRRLYSGLHWKDYAYKKVSCEER